MLRLGPLKMCNNLHRKACQHHRCLQKHPFRLLRLPRPSETLSLTFYGRQLSHPLHHHVSQHRVPRERTYLTRMPPLFPLALIAVVLIHPFSPCVPSAILTATYSLATLSHTYASTSGPTSTQRPSSLRTCSPGITAPLPRLTYMLQDSPVSLSHRLACNEVSRTLGPTYLAASSNT